MGMKISKCYSTYKLQPKVFKLIMNFPPNGPDKTTFGIWSFELSIFNIFFLQIANSPL